MQKDEKVAQILELLAALPRAIQEEVVALVQAMVDSKPHPIAERPSGVGEKVWKKFLAIREAAQ